MTFEDGIKQTIKWYIKNTAWTDSVIENSNSLKRLGLG